jgi:glycosyltransferase involved in cell wall biosynthesis
MRFSIIVTSYNQREFIRNAVDSALAARNAEAEVIVVDDGSTDGSCELLSAYGDAIRLAAMPENRGAAAARNHGAGIASGDYLVFVDGDDALAPWALKMYERVIQTDEPKLILATLQWFSGPVPAAEPGQQPREIRVAHYEDYMRKDRTFGPSATALVIERRALESVRGWSDDFPVMEDVDLLIKLGETGPAVQILAPHTAFYRVHPGNTMNNISRYLRQMRTLLNKERVGDYPGGSKRRFERYAVMGGHVMAFVQRAVQSGLYRDAFALAALGWPMVFASIVRKCNVALRGPRPCEVLAV